MEIVDLLSPDHPQYDEPFRTLVDSDSAYDMRIGQMMLDLLAVLRQRRTGLLLFASTASDHELWLNYSAPDRRARSLITISIDSRDYGPFDNGLPHFHYRLSCRIGSPADTREQLPIEDRVTSVELACEFVLKAIDETRKKL